MLTRKYGLLTITMMAISATLGSSILISFGQVAYQAQFNPILMLLAWIIGALLIIPGLLLFAETTSSYPENGTAYTWLKKAKFQATAFWFGWILVLIVAATAIASATIACGNLIASLAGITNSWVIKLLGIGVLIAMSLTHIYTKKIVGISQIIFTLLKFIPILLLIILAIIYGSLANFEKPEVKDNLHQLFLTSYMLLPAIAMTMFAYSGIESVTYVAGEIKEPRKNIIRAKIIAVLVVVGIYVILAVAIITINISNNLNVFSSNLWNDAILSSKTIPHGFALGFNILSIIIFLGSLNAFLLYHSRIVHKLAQENDLFSIFSRASERTNSPYLAIVLLMLLSSVYVLWDQLYSVVTYFIIATTVLQFVAFSVALKLRYKDPTYKRMFNNFWYWFLFLSTIISNFLCLIGAIISMYVFARDSHDWWNLYKCFIVCTVLVAGFPIYYIKEFIKKRMICIKNKKKNLILKTQQ